MHALSFSQERLWFLDQLNGPSATYNAPAAVWLRGALDRKAVRLALNDVANRQESLRTIFIADNGSVRQRILSGARSSVELHTISIDELDVPAELVRLAKIPFDLTSEVPFRAHLLAINEGLHVLLLVLHHIATDGTSDGPLYRDLGVAYQARLRGCAPNWKPLEIQYVDFVAWQRELLGGPATPTAEAKRQLSFWSQALAGLPTEVIPLPDRQRPSVASHRGGALTVRCSANVHANLLVLARESRTTFFMVVQAAVSVLLFRMGAGDDIAIGSTVEGRSEEVLDDIVGFFVNTVVLRADLSDNPSFRDLLGRVREFDLAAFDHQDLPFDMIVEAVNPARSTARHPLFQVLVAVEDAEAQPLKLHGLSTQFEPVRTGMAKFDQSYVITRHYAADGAPGELEVTVEYATDLYDSDSARETAQLLARLLAAVADHADTRISDVELRATARADPTVEPTLNFGAVRIGFDELSDRVGRLETLLRARGAAPRSVIAVVIDDPIQRIIAMMAAFGTGADCVSPECGEPTPDMVVTDSTAGTAREGLPTTTLVIDSPEAVAILRSIDLATSTLAGRFRAFVLDRRLLPVPTGIVGELYLADYSRAGGIAGPADATARQLVANPLEPGTRMYRTSELARYSTVGHIQLVHYSGHGATELLDRRNDSASESDDGAVFTALQQQLCAIFAEVLGVSQVGIWDNFFKLGGYSLLAIQLTARINNLTVAGVGLVTISDVYRGPTVALLAEQLVSRARGNPMEPVLRMREGSREPLFCLPAISGLSWIYSAVLPHIEASRGVIGLQSDNLTNSRGKSSTLEEIADEHVARIRRVQPSGPYHLMGWSFGGIVAHAVAVRLEAKGERVSTLALLDSYPLPDVYRSATIDYYWVLRSLLGERADGLPKPATADELVELLRTHDLMFGTMEPLQVHAVVSTTAKNAAAHLRYRVSGVFSGKALFFDALGTDERMTPGEAWADHIKGTIEVHGIDCTHMEMTGRPQLAHIGEVLDNTLSG